MASFRLPVDPTEPHQRQGFELGGSSFLLDLDWNERNQAWFFSLFTNDEIALIEGFRVVIGARPLRRVTDSRRPAGDIQFVDTGVGSVDPGRDDLGNRVILLYHDPETAASLAGL